MSDNSNIINALHLKDLFCCIQMQKEMIVDTNLRITTSNLYPELQGNSDLESILRELYYMPSSLISLDDNSVLARLLKKSCNVTTDHVSVLMKSEYAQTLVSGSAKTNAKEIISLILGNNSYRCAFSDLTNVEPLDEIKVLDSTVPVESNDECARIGLLIWRLATDANIRDDALACNDQGNLVRLLTTVDIDNYGPISDSTANNIAKAYLDKNLEYLVSYIGINMYNATW